MKGIILAGGSGTRLYPSTIAVSKQLIPVYDKPMIYYPLSTLMLAGLKDVLIITTPHDQASFHKLLGDGSALGMSIEYVVQPKPEGLAQAFILAETFLNGEPSCLILGDNIFYTSGLRQILAENTSLERGARVFGYYVNDARRYGVVEFDEHFNAISIEEKPEKPKSNYAIPGLYFFDSRAPQFAREQKPSARGELEITDLINRYLELGELKVSLFGRGTAWLDTGTHDSLTDATNFVAAIEKRQGLKIGCLEEISLVQGFIDLPQFLTLAERFKGEYRDYLLTIADQYRQK